ncbi:MAG: 50S ribosomal protein L5 [Patescibacteria group bacterium]|nr:50S ribosomal protein L5 [Patescibacteria group bacterium]MDE2116689.1 50S ribosomal protein L5 [Patescibacteria group bacterium]
MKTLKEKQKDAFLAMKKEFGYENAMEAPKVTKVVVSSGVGSFKDKKKIELALDRIERITGQKPVLRGAKKSIAAYKSREGDPMGYLATLRGEKMWNFLEKLVHIALPRTKDFRGLPPTSMDGMGGYSIGVREHTIFPETTDEELKDVFGLGVTIVTNVRDRQQNKRFLELLGFPIKKA